MVYLSWYRILYSLWLFPPGRPWSSDMWCWPCRVQSPLSTSCSPSFRPGCWHPAAPAAWLPANKTQKKLIRHIIVKQQRERGTGIQLWNESGHLITPKLDQRRRSLVWKAVFCDEWEVIGLEKRGQVRVIQLQAFVNPAATRGFHIPDH